MMAVGFAEFGGPEMLRMIEQPDLSPAADEVVVAVHASTVNPTDVLTLSGARASLMTDLTPPYIAGMDFSGRVLAVGSAVAAVRPGQPVIGVVSPRRPEGGSQAEQVRVPARSVAAIREGSDLVAAATIPMNALTGLLCLELLNLGPESNLLITGAAGMLGSLSAELALLDGLNVVAVARESDRKLLDGLGVKTLVTPGPDLNDALQAACPGGFDGVIDGALIGREILHLLPTGASIVSPRASYRIEDPRLAVHYVQVINAIGDEERIRHVGRLFDAGKLTPRVAPKGVFGKSRAADAYRMVQRGGFRGRVVLTFKS